MNFTKIISGLFVSTMFLASAYAAINSPINNTSSVSTSTSFIQLDNVITA